MTSKSRNTSNCCRTTGVWGYANLRCWLFYVTSWPGQSERWKGMTRPGRPIRQRGSTPRFTGNFSCHAPSNKGKHAIQENEHHFFPVYLKVLVVVRVNAETGHKAIHHELHISILTARSPPEGFGWVEQQSLMKHSHLMSFTSTFLQR